MKKPPAQNPEERQRGWTLRPGIEIEFDGWPWWQWILVLVGAILLVDTVVTIFRLIILFF